MFRTGKIATRTEEGYWLVPGHNGAEYEVREESDGTFLCSCKDAQFRSHQGELCKHSQFILLLKESERVRAVVDITEARPPIDLDIHLHKSNRIVIC